MGMEGKCIRIRVRIRNAQAAQCTVGVVEGTVKGVCTWNYWLYMEFLDYGYGIMIMQVECKGILISGRELRMTFSLVPSSDTRY